MMIVLKGLRWCSIRLGLLAVLLWVFILPGCHEEEGSIKREFTVSAIDSTFFNECIVIVLKSKSGDEFYLFSPRPKAEESLAINDNFQPLEIGARYMLSIFPYAIAPSVTSNSHFHGNPLPYYSNNDSLLWDRGTLYQKVYYSPAIRGQYIEISESKRK